MQVQIAAEARAQQQADELRAQLSAAEVNMENSKNVAFITALGEAERRLHGEALQAISLETQRIRQEMQQSFALEREQMLQ